MKLRKQTKTQKQSRRLFGNPFFLTNSKVRNFKKFTLHYKQPLSNRLTGPNWYKIFLPADLQEHFHYAGFAVAGLRGPIRQKKLAVADLQGPIFCKRFHPADLQERFRCAGFALAGLQERFRRKKLAPADLQGPILCVG
ncbi:hypothetical protein OU798_05970 [Prolixibacteraceae bacterium Z1-6]|uniref:Uncharacterized protein n=1 Tax=Draconibacterium aestuarii TaxID=2998507 RepID=A0A9X3J6Q5_9BACT|nr:hypothetical protein [Prolixibacteraceae bacterium Z1-6]